MDFLGLEDDDVIEPAQVAKVVEGMAMDLALIDDEADDDAGTAAIEVGFDHHQSKHQTTVLPGLQQYGGEKAADESRFTSSTGGVEWHRTTTAETVRRWVVGQEEAHALDPAGKVVLSASGED